MKNVIGFQRAAALIRKVAQGERDFEDRKRLLHAIMLEAEAGIQSGRLDDALADIRTLLAGIPPRAA